MTQNKFIIIKLFLKRERDDFFSRGDLKRKQVEQKSSTCYYFYKPIRNPTVTDQKLLLILLKGI